MCVPTVADVERKQTLPFVQGNPVGWVARDNVPWRGVRAANLELNKKAAEKFFAQCANERKQTLPFVQGNSVDWVARDNVPWRGVRAANLELNKKSCGKNFRAMCQ